MARCTQSRVEKLIEKNKLLKYPKNVKKGETKNDRKNKYSFYADVSERSINNEVMVPARIARTKRIDITTKSRSPIQKQTELNKVYLIKPLETFQKITLNETLSLSKEKLVRTKLSTNIGFIAVKVPFFCAAVKNA